MEVVQQTDQVTILYRVHIVLYGLLICITDLQRFTSRVFWVHWYMQIRAFMCSWNKMGIAIEFFVRSTSTKIVMRKPLE
jgi:hypothetical protein